MEGASEICTYTFSAKQQDEVKAIRQKYLPQELQKQESDTMAQLHKLDKSATRPGTAAAIAAVIAGGLIHCVGVGIMMSGAAGVLPVLLGTLAGLAGLVMLFAAHPLYRFITKKRRQAVAPQILSLCDKLLK